MKIKWRIYLMTASVLLLILGGCSKDMQVSAEEIIHNAVEKEDEVDEYYGKYEMKLFDGEEIIEHAIMEEYVSGIERKIVSEGLLEEGKSEVVNNGETMLVYDETNETAHEMDTSGLADIYAQSPKESYQMILDGIQNSHTYELVGEEKVLDRDTFHIKLEAKEPGDLLGDMEIWVDKDSWIIVKSASETGDMRSETEFVELDLSPDFDEDTFTMDIPDDIEIVDIEDSFNIETITLEEAEETLEQPFYHFSEEEFNLEEIELYPGNEDVGNNDEINLIYTSKEDVPLFSLSVFPTPEDIPVEESELEIRGNTVEYEESINFLIWDEEGLRYNIFDVNEDIEIEEIVEWAEEMVLSSEE